MPLSPLLRPRLLRSALAALLAVLAVATPALAATGPDVSRYQHPDGGAVDWQRVAAGGQDFTWIKATEGADVTNSWFTRDRTGARAAGLYTGAYHFARPSTAPGSAATQAQVFADTIGDQQLPGTLPPALDLETSNGLSSAQLVSWTRTFLTRLEALTGRRPVVYTYPAFWSASMGGTRSFAGYPLWIAHYARVAAPTHTGWDDWAFWQYSSTASVDGIKGDVDMNRFHGTDADLARLALAPVPVSGGGIPTGTSPGALEVPRDTLPGRYVPVTARRVLDTRAGSPVTGDLTLTLPDDVPADSAGVVLSVSAVRPEGPGYVRSGAAGTSARTTALNFVRRASSTGLVVTRTDAARRAVLTVEGAATHLVADLVGYYDVREGTGGHYVALTPSRIVDTRTGVGAAPGAVVSGLDVPLPDAVPAGARSAVLNVSVVGPVHDTFVQLGGATVLNVAAGTSRTGLVLAPSGRTPRLTVTGGPAQVVVDLLGYYSDDTATGSSWIGTAPARVVDTRRSLGGVHGARAVTVQLPSSVQPGATAVLDVSAVDPTGPGYLRVAAAGETATTTALNVNGGQSQTGLVLTRVDSARRVTLTLYGYPADLVVDLVGQLALPAAPAAPAAPSAPVNG
ncbi:MAG: hypothetical protein JWN17_1874 [Frankiales bacterium]|nr:hypothetical protein [Frankiales bacterium]